MYPSKYQALSKEMMTSAELTNTEHVYKLNRVWLKKAEREYNVSHKTHTHLAHNGYDDEFISQLNAYLAQDEDDLIDELMGFTETLAACMPVHKWIHFSAYAQMPSRQFLYKFGIHESYKCIKSRRASQRSEYDILTKVIQEGKSSLVIASENFSYAQKQSLTKLAQEFDCQIYFQSPHLAHFCQREHLTYLDKKNALPQSYRASLAQYLDDAQDLQNLNLTARH